MTNTLNAYERNCLSWIEQHYHKTKNFPDPAQIQAEWPRTFPTITDLQNWLDSPKIKAALNNRGLSQANAKNNLPLTQTQSAAILLVANLSDRRNLKAKLSSIGVTLTQWNAWKKQVNFKHFLHSQLTDDFDTSLDRALTGLLSAVDAGNTRAIELYMEMTGRQPTENERNFKLAVSRIIESVTRHVKDPEIIRAIAEDFDKIEQGMDPSQTINITQNITQVQLTQLPVTIWETSEHSLEGSI
jgi:hypothetical protein